MSYSMLKCILAFVVFSRTVGAQEAASTVSTLERLAVRAALDHSLGSAQPGLRIVIDPMIVRANVAPGDRDSTLRESSRNSYLTQAFRARSLPRDSVLVCNPRPCKMRDVDVLVTLSEPAIVGDMATITVTTVRPVHLTSHREIPIETQYQTINVRFEKHGASWQVVGFDDLGMS